MTSPIKASFKSEWFPLLIVIAGFAVGIYFYQNFPAVVATHWNFQGQPNGYSPRAVAAFAIPILITVMYLAFLFLPYLDPRREQYAQFASTYHQFKSLIMMFLFVIFIFSGLGALGYAVNIGFWMPIFVGILFAVIGFMLRNVKSNWFFGIRTPWTLSSEKVWAKTHEASWWVFLIAGILMALAAFGSPMWKGILLVVSILVIALGLPLYSYLLFRQEKQGK